MRVILHSWCQIQRTSSSLRYATCGPGHIQSIFSTAYLGFIIHVNVSALLLEISRQFNARYTANLVQIQRTSYGLRNVNCGPGHIQCIYRSAYSVLNIELNVSALLFEIYRYLHARYTANLVPNTEHILRFTLCELCHRLYTKYFQHRIFRLQYSAVGICAAIVHITTIQCAL
jgi:hypothetical protein